jgi:hypothetical protein
MPEDLLDPEDCLRSLAAEALLWAPHRPLFPVSLGLMAVVNEFVMLGLLPEPWVIASLIAPVTESRGDPLDGLDQRPAQQPRTLLGDMPAGDRGVGLAVVRDQPRPRAQPGGLAEPGHVTDLGR